MTEEKFQLILKFVDCGTLIEEWRSGDVRRGKDMSEDEMFKLLSSDGMLVKRPLLITGNKVLTGFKEEDWKNAL
ncbi:MAG: hypothetical protein K6A90_00510 [Lachnospiraceae bacterium]|nr:hypothetical protein [Lachnospiraceae bacterium]